jgi:hypothetical protein
LEIITGTKMWMATSVDYKAHEEVYPAIAPAGEGIGVLEN